MKYDCIVIGSGAGLNVLDACIRRRLHCALIESGKIGGTCLTTGCIPSKILAYPASIIRQAQHAVRVGCKFQYSVDWDYIQRRMWKQINESQEIEKGLKQIPNLDIFRGIGEFVDKYSIRVNLNGENKQSETLQSEKIVIASGARSFIPQIAGLEKTDFVTSESFFGEKFPQKPWKSLIIIGGGVIAMEFAHIFSAVGTDVKIIEMLPRLASTEEPEVSEFLANNLKKHIEIYLNNKAVAARTDGDEKAVIIEDIGTGRQTEARGEEIFVASGRRSNSDLLKPQRAGIEVNKNGWIKVNQFLETTVNGIWCIGDANGGIQLRHRANYDADICVHNIFSNGKDRKPVDYSATPWAIHSYPEIGHVGMTEKEALEAGYKIYVAINHYSSVAEGYARGIERNDSYDGFAKIVVDEFGKILGAHVVGPDAALLVQPFVYLMNAGVTCTMTEKPEKGQIKQLYHLTPDRGTVEPIASSMVIHPTLNEVTGWAIGSFRPINMLEHQHS